MSELIQTTFDYDQPSPSLSGKVSEPAHREEAEVDARWDDGLDEQTREFVQAKTDEIHGQLKRTAEGIIQIGLNLIAVKQRLPHGQFLPWLKADFAMSEPQAVRCMQVARRFGEESKSITMMDFSPIILYTLAAPSTSDSVVEQVLTGEIAATLADIKAAKEAEKRRADEAEQAWTVAEHQLQELVAEVATLQHQLSETPQVIETTVENPETEAELARLQEKYAQIEAKLKIKTERVKVLSEQIHLHESLNQQERYNEQIRYKFRQACDAFHLGVKQGITRMVTALDAASAFEADDWARLADVENTLKRALTELVQLRESVTSQFVDAEAQSLP